MDLHVHLTKAALVLGSLGGTCMALSVYVFFREIAEVNRKLPEDEHFSYWSVHLDKAARIKDEYGRLYPDGQLHHLQVVLEIVGAVLLFFASIVSLFLPASLSK